MTTKEYIEKHARGAVWATLGTGILPETVICQSALESGLGMSQLASKYNNYFGIKAGTSWKGKIATFNTKEYVNGQYITISDKFRAYNSFAESAADYVQFLRSNKRYVNVFNQKDIYNQLIALKVAGYATAPNYVNAIMAVYNNNKQTIIDAIKKARIELLAFGLVVSFGVYRLIKIYLPKINRFVK